ncbi:unnamed protein product [Amoebophrya sp. A120]|nr:unnamed protein product [Amoebophrya sp. A120]|eukprot:GSA120T00012120001.1
MSDSYSQAIRGEQRVDFAVRQRHRHNRCIKQQNTSVLAHPSQLLKVSRTMRTFNHNPTQVS